MVSGGGSGGIGLSRKRGTASIRYHRRGTDGGRIGTRTLRHVPSIYANLILSAVILLSFACIIWTYVLLASSSSSQHQTWKGRRRRANDLESIQSKPQRLIQRRIDQRLRYNEEFGGDGGGGWEGYAQRRREENGISPLDQLARRYHETRNEYGYFGGGGDRLYERINRRRRAYFEGGGVDDDQFRVSGLHLPKPVIVVGMPKSGTTSIFSYFKCGGQRSSHFACNNHFTVNDDPDRPPVDVVEAEPWRNCRLPAGDGGDGGGKEEEDSSDGDSDEGGGADSGNVGNRDSKRGLNIDTGNFPLCSVCVERNVRYGRPPLEGCGAYDVWTGESARGDIYSCVCRCCLSA